MDLPWNPAVLEQRIGRVHRLGQKQPVRVVNFVAQGTIEEGMLGVLKFKKSLFAGVLDGGETEVFLGGSRLTKFMETVEATTAQIPAAIATEAEEASEAKRELAPAKAEQEGRFASPCHAGRRPVERPVASGHGAGAATVDRFAASAERGRLRPPRRSDGRSVSCACRCRRPRLSIRRCKWSGRFCKRSRRTAVSRDANFAEQGEKRGALRSRRPAVLRSAKPLLRGGAYRSNSANPPLSRL